MANEFQHKDPGVALTQAEYITTDGTGHIFDCQATGDILYASSATVLKNLDRGNANEILSMGGSCIPAWTASPTLGSLSVDNFTLNGTELDLSSGDFTLDVAGDVEINADGGCINFKDASLALAAIVNTSCVGELRLHEAANYIGLKPPALSANQTWTWPATKGSCGQTLTCDGCGVLSWASGGVGCGPLRIAGGSAGAPAYSFGTCCDTNVGMFRAAADTLAWSAGGTERMRLEGCGTLLMNTTCHTNITMGAVICQGANDDQALTFRSSDLATGLTSLGFPFDFTVTDYGAIGKIDGGTGGLVINGMTDEKIGVKLNGWMITHCAAKSTSGTAPVMLQATRHNAANAFSDFETGGGSGCSNIVVFWQKDCTYDRARFIFDVLGNFHADNGSGTFDAYCDAALSRALDLNSGGTIESHFDQFIHYNEQTLIDAKILGAPIACGGMLNVTGLQRLHNGAIWQLHTQMLTQREEIDSLKTQMQSLSEGK